MGLRLRAQLLILCLSLIGVSLTVIAYFNISAFRLSFFSDEQSKLKSTGLKVCEAILKDINDSSKRDSVSKLETSLHAFDLQRITGLNSVELWDQEGELISRIGDQTGSLPQKQEFLKQLRGIPLPIHLFLDSTPPRNPSASPYEKSLALQTNTINPTSTNYQLLFPVFGQTKDDLSKTPTTLPSRSVQAILHLTFDIGHGNKKIGLVTVGNLLIALTFLLTTLMAVHLWSEHALYRPLKGLIQSMKHLDTSPAGPELASHNELVKLSKTLHRLALERLKYQKQLETLNLELEAQVEENTLEMKEFFSLVTHDLRIPLAAVQGYCDLLQRKPEALNERQSTFVDRIAIANGHSLELVRNLLEAMKIEFGTLAPVMEDFVFQELAEEVQNELNVDDTVAPVSLKAKTREAEEVTVHADRTRIKRVLTNLLSNAQKHSKNSPLVLLSWHLSPGDEISVEISDEGVGISKEEQIHLFEKFTKTPKNNNSSGLGLGLYIVGKILESHKQEVSVKSELGVGTTFGFHLPVSPS